MGLKEILEEEVIDRIWARLPLGPVDLPISKHMLMIALGSLLLAVGLPLLIRSRARALAPFRAMLEIVVLFLRDEVVLPNLGHKGAGYTGYFCTLFFFILIRFDRCRNENYKC